MKFNLPRQLIKKEIIPIISREATIQNKNIIRADKKLLKGILNSLPEISQPELKNQFVRKKLPNNLGYGIFLHPEADPILKNQVIAPYSGILALVPTNDPNDTGYMFELLSEIRLNKEDQLLIHPDRPYHPNRLYSLQLDALKKGNFTRFINHSSKPNLVAHLVSSCSKNSYDLEPMPIEVIYITKKTIKPGEQLLISYENPGENNYWGPAKIKPFPMTPTTFTLSISLKICKTC